MLVGISGKINCGKSTVGDLIRTLSSKDWELRQYAAKLKQIAGILAGVDSKNFEDREFKETAMSDMWQEPYRAPVTYRNLLQKVGTDALRNNLHTNVWVNALFADYTVYSKGKALDPHNTFEAYHHMECAYCKKSYPGYKRQSFCKECVDDPEVQFYPDWLITDVRYPNEARAIEERGGIVLRIDRPNSIQVFGDDEDLTAAGKLAKTIFLTPHQSETALDSYPFEHRIKNDGSLEGLEAKVVEFLTSTNLL